MPTIAVLALFGGMLVAIVVAGAYYALGKRSTSSRQEKFKYEHA